MEWTPTQKKMRALWPGVSPHEVLSVLSDQAKVDPTAVDALLEEALNLPPADAATRLMAPVIAAVDDRKPWDRAIVISALDALIRAGGDPMAVLAFAVGELEERRTTETAARMLRRAALNGWSLAGVAEQLANCRVDKERPQVRRAYRLAALQERGFVGEIRKVAAVYHAHRPMGDLHGGIGVLQEQLLSDDMHEVRAARDALDNLVAAGERTHDSWLALLPVLTQQLGEGKTRRQEAARAVSQLRYALKDASEPDRAALPGKLAPVVNALAGVLTEVSPAADSAAEALGIVVGFGASLEAVRPQIDAALGHAQVGVRSDCSRALSVWLVREGIEEAVPARCSRRRVYATSDEPLEGEKVISCEACDAPAPVLYRYEEINQFDEHHMVETLCPACGLYSEHHWGYG